MSGFEKKVSLTGDRGFESFSLHRRICCEPDPRRSGIGFLEDGERGAARSAPDWFDGKMNGSTGRAIVTGVDDHET
jgi:hypothetical protein